ncbi:uncharacterized protein A4U43_C01F26930 [Asparagus officinalis]|uniref:Uncharacterized protein n=1 Tax=Asparagus officinalis TaxID=4686 RepID=A0A5P1FSE2_ASPOF|nr:uncharacterized protein A4U43_C01F26930 [Asparagus officinalis]
MSDPRGFKEEYGAGGDQAHKYRTDEHGNPIYEQKGGAAGYGVTTGDYGTTPHEGALGGGGKTGPQSGKD